MRPRTEWVLAGFLIVAGVLGWIAAFALTIDKFAVLENPEVSLSCNFSVIVQCGANLQSAQGSAFGFPNPLLGLAGFIAPIVVGASILAGARFARWYWIAFNLGIALALAFVIWLMGQSIFVLGTLCPWCMLVWSVTIPLFWAVTFRNLRRGVFSRPRGAAGADAGADSSADAGGILRRVGTVGAQWIVPITLLSYVIVAVIAQLRLDVLQYL